MRNKKSKDYIRVFGGGLSICQTDINQNVTQMYIVNANKFVTGNKVLHVFFNLIFSRWILKNGDWLENVCLSSMCFSTLW
jgi:hypothetical protein